MACNCVSQEQIKKLHEIYGEKVKASTPTTLKFKINDFLTKVGVGTIVILVSPAIIFHILYTVWFTKERKISIRKLMGFKKTKTMDAALAKTILENVDNQQKEEKKRRK